MTQGSQAPVALAHRLPVWLALSELWLDTELDDGDIQRLAHVLAASGYSDAELSSIFLDELSPVVADNLLSVAGVWAGFDAAWLEAQILRRLAWLERQPAWRRRWVERGLTRRWRARITRGDWERLMGALPAARAALTPG